MSQMNAADAIAEVNGNIAAAARGDDRQPEDGRAATDVQLIAVTKTYDATAIRPVLDAGHRSIWRKPCAGSRRQVARSARLTYTNVELHLIGPLQSNKARQAVELFDAIHTVDRRKIAQAIASEMQSQGKALQLFIQVNTGEEPQKAGIAPAETADFVNFCRDDLKLTIHGLMCIPPIDEEPGVHFALLGELARDCGLTHLSMGMSSDYPIAIQFGATHVRVGSAIFGARS